MGSWWQRAPRPSRHGAWCWPPAGGRCPRPAATAPASCWRPPSATRSSPPPLPWRRCCWKGTSTRGWPACPTTRPSPSNPAGARLARVAGSLLWTHLRHQRPGGARRLAPLAPGGPRRRRADLRSPLRPASTAAPWNGGSSIRPPRTPRSMPRTCLAAWLPAAVAEAILESLGLDPSQRLGQMAAGRAAAPGAGHRRLGVARDGQPGLQLRGSDGGGCRARGDPPRHDGVAPVPGPLPGRRDAGRGRPLGRLQFPVGLVERLGRRPRPHRFPIVKSIDQPILQSNQQVTKSRNHQMTTIGFHWTGPDGQAPWRSTS